MPLSIYSPNSTTTGSALFISLSSKDGAMYFNLLKQVSWDANTKKASFKDGARLNVKFSLDEVGEMVNVIKNRGKWNFYHNFSETVVSGGFTYYSKEYDYKGKKVTKTGYGLTVKKGDQEWKVGFTLGSAEKLLAYLNFFFDRCFQAIYAADKKAFEEKQKNKKTLENPPEEVLDKAADEQEKENEENLEF